MTTTLVVGAGPAGLLFVIVGRLLADKAGVAWAVRLFDKRQSYARTHRLRMDPAPYRAIQRDVADPRFDALVAMLDGHGFSPEVNVLEESLSSLATELGVVRELREIGDRASLLALRREVSGPCTIVAADSVHSAVRAIASPDGRALHATHERLARLRVRGDALPAQLGLVDRVRVSKVLGSIVDYRLNRNGYAEVDLFLTEAEHAHVRTLGASPRAPVVIAASGISRLRAPLFRAIVEHLEEGLGGRHVVEVQSTFELEHTVAPRCVLTPADLDATVFLVGDAAVSLPFFRGMASLAACAHALARAHVEIACGRTPRYEEEARAIVSRELDVIRSRARLVRGTREAFRVASMLPFPIQSWLLRARELHPERERFTPGFFLNAIVALAAASLVVAGSWLDAHGIDGTWLALAAFPIELLGGACYRGALALQAPPHRWVARVWALQIATLFVAGVGLAAPIASGVGWVAAIASVTWWFSIAVPFVLGMLLFERVTGTQLARAGLPDV